MPVPIDLTACFQNEAMLRRVFNWLTRVGAGVKFGTRPIGWYQQHQCACIDVLKRRRIFRPIVREGRIIDRTGCGEPITPDALYREADAAARK